MAAPVGPPPGPPLGGGQWPRQSRHLDVRPRGRASHEGGRLGIGRNEVSSRHCQHLFYGLTVLDLAYLGLPSLSAVSLILRGLLGVLESGMQLGAGLGKQRPI
jgi:hypothetical protein